jgi:hypothetical protein
MGGDNAKDTFPQLWWHKKMHVVAGLVPPYRHNEKDMFGRTKEFSLMSSFHHERERKTEGTRAYD